jgi:hypothetical protein
VAIEIEDGAVHAPVRPRQRNTDVLIIVTGARRVLKITAGDLELAATALERAGSGRWHFEVGSGRMAVAPG